MTRQIGDLVPHFLSDPIAGTERIREARNRRPASKSRRQIEKRAEDMKVHEVKALIARLEDD